jgi:hypothetical protein
MSSFTAIGARRAGYSWRRHAVSSLADGRGGWSQRANFALTGALYCIAAHGLARSPKPTVGPRVVPALIFGVGGGLVGSGLFVTDPVAGFPPAPSEHDDPERTRSIAPTRGGRLHNLCAIPIFAGIPVAALICATSAARRGARPLGCARVEVMTDLTLGVTVHGLVSLDSFDHVVGRADALGCDAIAEPISWADRGVSRCSPSCAGSRPSESCRPWRLQGRSTMNRSIPVAAA